MKWIDPMPSARPTVSETKGLGSGLLQIGVRTSIWLLQYVYVPAFYVCVCVVRAEGFGFPLAIIPTGEPRWPNQTLTLTLSCPL